MPGRGGIDQHQPGQPGAPGTAIAFAHITSAGGVDEANWKGIADANVTHGATGVYCFNSLGFTPRNVIATADFESTHVATATIAANHDISACPGSEQAAVEFTCGPTDATSDTGFFVIFN